MCLKSRFVNILLGSCDFVVYFTACLAGVAKIYIENISKLFCAIITPFQRIMTFCVCGANLAIRTNRAKTPTARLFFCNCRHFACKIRGL